MKLGDVGEIITGGTPSTKIKEYYSNEGIGYCWYSPSDLIDNRIIYNSKKKLTELGLRQVRKIPVNSIMVTCIGSTIGKIGMTFNVSATNQQINSIICNKSNSEYIYYYLLFIRDSIKKMAGRQAIPIVNKSLFSKLNIPIPTLTEQKQIADILTTVDEKIDNLQNQKIEFTHLKKGLMQKLLTGEWRVS